MTAESDLSDMKFKHSPNTVKAPLKIIGGSEEASVAIRVTRVLCISLMMSVHVWPGASMIISAEPWIGLDIFYSVVIDEFGRASVPLLSLVSGFLAWPRMFKGSAGSYVISRARALLIPMVIWSAALLSLRIIWGLPGVQDAGDLLSWANALFSLNAPPVNEPLGFLRDAFFCSVLSIVIGNTFKIPILSLAIIAIWSLVEFQTDGLILLRPPILFFFWLGLAVGLSARPPVVPTWISIIAIYSLDIFMRQIIPVGWTPPLAVSENFHRFAVALLMWRIAIGVVRKNGPSLRIALRWEPLIFLVFCSHMLTISVVGEVIEYLGVFPVDSMYLIAFIVQLFAAFMMAWIVYAIGSYVAPSALALAMGRPVRLSGG